MTNQTNKQKRPRIAKGNLVYSTNPIQLACIRALTIIHSYNPLTYKRIRREVQTTNT